ncbi:ergothioneine biosynthesis protein EgtC [Myxosarcina sp. GI1]|uniref:ergothioneine biosynthesis protein EgtC n=1 Tax=Myxosarcina sp. GI1 TaxID=1541065 RepID=UPI00056BECBE|nr:ergothioneine biosynthesis protein EgtC [Myxosarcina sp. GI1]
MCRLLGYLGSAVTLDRLFDKPEHSLIVQSYQPREMTAGLMNADGFGIGWYHASKLVPPFTYKNILPIWNDINLSHLNRYVESHCVLGYVRSATSGLSVDLINCQPFTHEDLLFIHNGYIDDFRKTMYRPIRNHLTDFAYRRIEGTTDSEHIFALVVSELESNEGMSIDRALETAIAKLVELSYGGEIEFSANVVISNGKELTACRYSNRHASPTLYYLKLQEDILYSNAVMIVSEPMFEGNWIECPEKSIISVGEDLEVKVSSIT